MADCEQLAGELQVLEQLLKKYSTEHTSLTRTLYAYRTLHELVTTA
jgi:hypothetical protein